MLKQTLIASAALALAAVPAFAWGGSHTSYSHSFNTSTKTVTVTKAEVNNHAFVNNMVFTASNTGLNSQDSTSTTSNGGSAMTGEGEKGGTSGDASNAAMGGNSKNVMFTGDAGASSVVTNAVNTTVISQ